jgi:hypothetical protein
VIGANGTVVSDNTISTAQIFFAWDLSEQIDRTSNVDGEF